MQNLLALIEVKKLPKLDPKTSPMSQFGCLATAKGKTVMLSNNNRYETVLLLEFLPDGQLRGNHYHTQKQEILYIIEGSLQGYFWLPEDTTNIQKITFTTGDFITIPSQIAHAYQAYEKTLVLELATIPYDPSDTYYQGITIS